MIDQMYFECNVFIIYNLMNYNIIIFYETSQNPNIIAFEVYIDHPVARVCFYGSG